MKRVLALVTDHLIRMKNIFLLVLGLSVFVFEGLGLDSELEDYPRDVDIGDSSYVGYSLAGGSVKRKITDISVENTVGNIELAVVRSLKMSGKWNISPQYRLKYGRYEDPQDFDGDGTLKVFKMYTPSGGLSMGVAEQSYTTQEWSISAWDGEEMKLNFGIYSHVVRADGSLELTIIMPSGNTAIFESTGAFNWYSLTNINFRIVRLEDRYGRGHDYLYSGSDLKPYRILNDGGAYLDYQYSSGFIRVDASDGQYAIYRYNDPTFGGFLTNVEYSDGTEAVYSKVKTGTNSRDLYLNDVRSGEYIADVKIEIGYDSTIQSSSVKKVSSLETGYLLSERTASRDLAGSITQATETRGDGAQRVATVWAQDGSVQTITDFKGNGSGFSYDTKGALIRYRDANGNLIQYSRESLFHLITKKTYPDSSYEEWGYEDVGSRLFVSSYRDQRGNITNFTRNSSGLITRKDYPDGSYETWSGFNQYGQATVHRLRNGAQEQFTYDSMGRLVSQSQPRVSGSTYWTSYSYYASSHVWANRLKTVTDPLGHSVTYEYDRKFVNGVQGSIACSGRGLVTKVINADGTSISFGFSPRGEKVWEEDELGNRTTYVYDAYGRILQVTDPLNRTTHTQYGDTEAQALTQVFPAPRRVISPSGKITAYLYDANKRMTLMAEADWSVDSKFWLYEYDSVGNTTKVKEMIEKNPNVYRETTFEYDSRNRKIKQTAPLGRVTQWEYDTVGNYTKIINPDNTYTRSNYNSMNQVSFFWDEMNQRTAYTYYSSGQVYKVTDPRSKVYTYTYDPSNRPSKLTYPDGSYEEWRYNSIGKVYLERNRSGDWLRKFYDNRDRETQRAWYSSAAPTVWTTYDAASRVLQKSNWHGILTYAYDDAGQVTSETQKIYGPTSTEDGRSDTVYYQYDDDGNEIVFSSLSGIWNGHTYNNRQQVSTIQSYGSSGPYTWASYDYDAAGYRSFRTHYNGTKSEYRYDSAGRLDYLNTYAGQPSSPIYLQEFGYDVRDRRTWVLRDSAYGDTWRYQADSQLIEQRMEVWRPDQNFWNSASFTDGFNYDAAGNRTSWNQNGSVTNYSTDSVNQYTAVTGLTIEHGDNRGNITKLGSWTFYYDAENRLKRAVGPGYDIWPHYDAHGRLSKIVSNGAYEYRFYDGSKQFLRQVQDGTWIDHTIWGVSPDEVISRYSPSDFWLFYHQDPLNSTVAITDWFQAVQERYKYDAFGGAHIFDGNWNARSSSALSNRYQFTGQEWWSEMGLHNFKARFYSSELGRFIQQDPLRFDAGDMNLYRYVGNNTINMFDPDGKMGISYYDSFGKEWARASNADHSGEGGTTRVELTDRVTLKHDGVVSTGTKLEFDVKLSVTVSNSTTAPPKIMGESVAVDGATSASTGITVGQVGLGYEATANVGSAVLVDQTTETVEMENGSVSVLTNTYEVPISVTSKTTFSILQRTVTQPVEPSRFKVQSIGVPEG